MDRWLVRVTEQGSTDVCNPTEEDGSNTAQARSYDERGVPQRGLLVSVGIQDSHGSARTNDHEVESGLSHQMNRPHYLALVEERHRHWLSRHLVGLQHMANRAAGEELSLDASR